MTDAHVTSVLQFVLSKFITTEAYRDGLNKGTRASFHMEPDQLVPVIKFITDKEGCELEQAMRRFTTCRDGVLQTQAKGGKDMNPLLGVFIAAIFAVFPALLLLALDINALWLNVVLAALVPTIFFGMLYLLVWSPRYKVKETVWAEPGALQEKLERLYKVDEMPLMEIISEHQRTQAIAFVGAAVLCIGGVTFLAAGDATEKADFHKNLAGITVSADNKGTRYAVYDTDKERYVDGYLSEASQAVTAEDVIGVLRITEGEEKVGTYSGGGNAYKRYVSITLVDQRTGETVGKDRISGGNPPKTIVSRNPFSKKNGYGSAPDKDDISRACASLIKKHQEQMNQNAFHQEMSQVTISADNAGTCYVVYDEEKAEYVNKYLSGERQAEEAKDVRGVLKISYSALEVGTYKGGGKAYQRYAFISLVDQRTGEEVSYDYVLGGDPPQTIYSFQKEGYGDYPTDEAIGTVCEKLIADFEGNET